MQQHFSPVSRAHKLIKWETKHIKLGATLAREKWKIQSADSISICHQSVRMHEKRNYHLGSTCRMEQQQQQLMLQMKFHSSGQQPPRDRERVMNRSLRRRHQHHHHQLLFLAASSTSTQADKNINNIIIQWIIRCNQSTLKHHKSKPAEPKQETRQRSIVDAPRSEHEHSLSSHWACLLPCPLDSQPYRIICSYRYYIFVVVFILLAALLSFACPCLPFW